jgi:transposase, IS5 family
VLFRSLLREGLLDKTNPASGMWADTRLSVGRERSVHGKERLCQSCPSQKTEGTRDVRGDPPRQQPQLENPFACRARLRRGADALVRRTIGIARATTKIGLANLAYNFKCLLFLQRIATA